MQAADVIVVGAGAAGASAAYELAAGRSVVVLEQESGPGYHATGRSAALFSEIYGNAVVRTLSRASRTLFDDPPEGFCEAPLTRSRGALFAARLEDMPVLEALNAEERGSGAVTRLSQDEVLACVPILRPQAAVAGLLEAGAEDIDVDALHQGYLRGLRRRGGAVATQARVTALRRDGGQWLAETTAGEFRAPVVVNAAGAWADEVARMAGAAPLGLMPKRRTVALVDGPAQDFGDWPTVIDMAETYYFKPDAGRLLISPADETDTVPCDAQPEELDIAIAVDRVETATTLRIGRVLHRWAGLRTFAPDRTPVCGFDGAAEGFFWLAGQGGYGIQTAPALARLAASLIDGSPPPPGVTPAAVSPHRFTEQA